MLHRKNLRPRLLRRWWHRFYRSVRVEDYFGDQIEAAFRVGGRTPKTSC